eukprot:3153192-Heterocapsa_arctica.AAC.1
MVLHSAAGMGPRRWGRRGWVAPGAEILCGLDHGAVVGDHGGLLVVMVCASDVGPGTPAALVRNDVIPWCAGEGLLIRVPPRVEHGKGARRNATFGPSFCNGRAAGT